MHSQNMIGLVALVAFFAATLATIFLLRLAPKIGLISQSNHRSSHRVEKPLSGGLGFALVFFLSLLFLYFTDSLELNYLVIFVGFGSAITAVGLRDDLHHLSIRWRLLAQFVCITLSAWLLGDFFNDELSPSNLFMETLCLLITIFLLAWWLNLFNFMDGIDGLAGSEAVFISIGAFAVIWFAEWVLAPEINVELQIIKTLLIILAASVSGFLIFNWPPSTLFMGDSGSTFLGFTLGMIALVSITGELLSIWTWLILSGVFWVDATQTLLQRMISNDRWYEAHRSHAYQHAVIKIEQNKSNHEDGRSHRKVVLMVQAINFLWLLPLAGISMIKPDIQVILLFIAWAPLTWIAFHFKAGKPIHT